MHSPLVSQRSWEVGKRCLTCQFALVEVLFVDVCDRPG